MFLQAGRDLRKVKIWYNDSGLLVLNLKAMANTNRIGPTYTTYSHNSMFMEAHGFISASVRAWLMWMAASQRLGTGANLWTQCPNLNCPKSIVQHCWKFINQFCMCPMTQIYHTRLDPDNLTNKANYQKSISCLTMVDVHGVMRFDR